MRNEEQGQEEARGREHVEGHRDAAMHERGMAARPATTT